jgi:hypothetical protein
MGESDLCWGVDGGPLRCWLTALGVRNHVLLARHVFDVNSVMKDNYRCWQADHGDVVWNRDVTSGLWSVSRRKRRPSSRNRKWRTALKAARSSLLKVEYQVPAPYSFFE